MKLSYEKPVTDIIQIQHKTHLLQVSGKFTDDAPEDGWDEGGANSDEYHFDNSLWDVDWNNDSN